MTIMTAAPIAYRASYRATAFSTDLRVVSLCAALGLVLTALFVALGFGAEIGQSLMAAG